MVTQKLGPWGLPWDHQASGKSWNFPVSSGVSGRPRYLQSSLGSLRSASTSPCPLLSSLRKSQTCAPHVGGSSITVTNSPFEEFLALFYQQLREGHREGSEATLPAICCLSLGAAVGNSVASIFHSLHHFALGLNVSLKRSEKLRLGFCGVCRGGHPVFPAHSTNTHPALASGSIPGATGKSGLDPDSAAHLPGLQPLSEAALLPPSADLALPTFGSRAPTAAQL